MYVKSKESDQNSMKSRQKLTAHTDTHFFLNKDIIFKISPKIPKFKFHKFHASFYWYCIGKDVCQIKRIRSKLYEEQAKVEGTHRHRHTHTHGRRTKWCKKSFTWQKSRAKLKIEPNFLNMKVVQKRIKGYWSIQKRIAGLSEANLL